MTPRLGVLAESDDEEHVGGFGGVAVEVVAVVEVSIRGGYVTIGSAIW